MREIDEKAIKFIAKNNIVVLRSAITGVALNVSYTEFGVSWTTDKNGLSLYYKRDESGTLDEKSDRVVVEKFVPRNHNSPALQAAEFLAIKKSLQAFISSRKLSSRTRRCIVHIKHKLWIILERVFRSLPYYF